MVSKSEINTLWSPVHTQGYNTGYERGSLTGWYGTWKYVQLGVDCLGGMGGH